MNNLEFLKYLNSISKGISKLTNPININEWFPKTNFDNQVGIATIELMKWYSDNNNFIRTHFNDVSKNISSISNIVKISEEGINNISKIKNINNDIFNKINSNGYWGNIAKLSLLNGIYTSVNEEETLDIDIITNNLENINLNIEQIESHPLDFFNSLFVSVKSYIDKNPSLKYSSIFLIWFISTIIIPLLIAKVNPNEEKKVNIIQYYNNSYIANSYLQNSSIFKINCKSVLVKNFPRNNSKTVYYLKKDDEIRILKDSLKWALIIKVNSIESGWIRKEYLNFSK